MCDEIDVEEHDVLDDPIIKGIFPDISEIKKEILHYEEGLEICTDYLTSASPPSCTQCDSIQANEKSASDADKAIPITGDVTECNVTECIEHKLDNATTVIKRKLHVEITVDTVDLTELDNSIEDIKCEDITHSNDIFLGNRIILGSRPSATIEDNDMKPDILSAGTEISQPHKEKCTYPSPVKVEVVNTDYENFFQTQLICFDVKVHLDNLEPYLEKCGRYCRKCLTLFPSKCALDGHIRNTHTLKCSRQTTLLSSKPTANKESSLSVNKTKCYRCNIIFTQHSSLLRHNANIHHKTERMKINKMISTVKNNLKNMPSSDDKSDTCFHCNKKFSSPKSLIEHLYNILQSKTFSCKLCTRKFTDKSKLDQHTCDHKKLKMNKKTKRTAVSIEDLSISNTRCTLKNNHKSNHHSVETDQVDSDKYCYRCHICFFTYHDKETCLAHLQNKHKLTVHPKLLMKSKLDLFCTICSRPYANTSSFKSHVKRHHNEKVNAKFELANTFQQELQFMDEVSDPDANNEEESGITVLKTVLFKCIKCDVHFLSAKTTTNHTDHMEMLVNWKCLTCKRIFKKADSLLHEKQHTLSNDFTVFDLCPMPTSRILYNCPKCTVHYLEWNFEKHYYSCEKKKPNSSYCKVCDILIDYRVASSHTKKHNSDNLKADDFIIVHSDVLPHNTFEIQEDEQLQCPSMLDEDEHSVFLKRNGKEPKRKKPLEYKMNLSYCSTCKCFLNTSFVTKLHVQGRCANLVKRVCGICGLMLTSKAYYPHTNLHRRKKIKLDDFKFYDFKSCKRIRPPLPVYPYCKRCKVHTISRRRHKCSDIDYLTCHLCNIKLTDKAFILHMSFHNYSKNMGNGLQFAEETKSREHQLLEDFDTTGFIYRCLNCQIAVDDYDKVIEHCHSHFGDEECCVETETCQMCDLRFDKSCYDRHLELHSSHSDNKHFFKILKFDTFYFTSENKIWTKHVFGGNISQKVASVIINKSIYKNECRIKMDVVQSGPPELTVYKCDRCLSFINEANIYKHAENSCFTLRQHPCNVCGIPFISSLARIQHEEIHVKPNIDVESYRILTFNKKEHKALNTLLSHRSTYHVLYQCRNCVEVVDKSQTKNHKCNTSRLKKCPKCGLFLNKNDYNRHIKRHKEVKSFTQENMRIILFGDVGGEIKDNSRSINTATFKGTVYDYTLYCCSECQICVKNYESSLKHTCSYGASRLKCSYCKLYFFNIMLRRHNKMHETDHEFVRGNIRIISFQPTNSDNSMVSKSTDTTTPSEGELLVEIDTKHSEAVLESRNAVPKDVVNEVLVKIYKCACGLHFLDPWSTLAHMNICTPNLRLTKLRCSKCSLLFTSKVLFRHLLKHHGEKKRICNFDIIEMAQDNIIYRCCKCKMHLEKNGNAVEHFEDCDGSTEGTECNVCNIKFESECFISHSCEKEFKVIDLRDISTT